MIMKAVIFSVPHYVKEQKMKAVMIKYQKKKKKDEENIFMDAMTTLPHVTDCKESLEIIRTENWNCKKKTHSRELISKTCGLVVGADQPYII